MKRSRRISLEGDACIDAPAIVCDTGSSTVKCGWAGDAFPRLMNPSVIGRLAVSSSCDVMQSDLSFNDWSASSSSRGRKCRTEGLVFGDEAYAHEISVSRPLSSGGVFDWSELEALWEWNFKSLIGLSESDDFPSKMTFALTESLFSTRKSRERVVESIFESFHGRAMSLSSQAALALCARGQRSGVVLDMGETGCRAVPVYEGFVQVGGVRTLPVGGKHVTDRLWDSISRSATQLGSSKPGNFFPFVQKLKESACFVAPSSSLFEYRKTAHLTHALSRPVLLPDGTNLEISSSRFMAPEVLFQPKLLGGAGHQELLGISEMLKEGISTCALDVRKALWGGLLLTGGGAGLYGVGNRIRNDLASIESLQIDEPPGKELLAFKGAAALAEMYSGFNDWWLDKSEYEESGPQAVHRLIGGEIGSSRTSGGGGRNSNESAKNKSFRISRTSDDQENVKRNRLSVTSGDLDKSIDSCFNVSNNLPRENIPTTLERIGQDA